MRFVIFGGGCYGTFYGRQLLRARRAGAAAVDEIRIVDHDPRCRAREELGEADGLRFDVVAWDRFLDDSLQVLDADTHLVTPPFTPHLGLAWLLRRLSSEVPGRDWRLEPFEHMPGTPFEQQREGGPLVVSHADWMCPVHCIEPETCPATRGPRTWDLDTTTRAFAEELALVGQPVDQVFLFHCHHIVYGVGGFPAGDVTAAYDEIHAHARRLERPLRFLVGTVSRCHGALHLLRAEAGTLPERCRPGTLDAPDPQEIVSPGMDTQGAKTVLLVEDNEDNLVVYRTILEHVGYIVLDARDGEEGVSRAMDELPDLILMDISIPKIDGWEATRRLKASEKTREIPVIALTAHALEEDRQKAIQAGCDGYLAKPVEPRRVVQEVERFLGPPTRPLDPVR